MLIFIAYYYAKMYNVICFFFLVLLCDDFICIKMRLLWDAFMAHLSTKKTTQYVEEKKLHNNNHKRDLYSYVCTLPILN